MVVAPIAAAYPAWALASCQPPRADQGGQIWFAGTQRTPGGVPRAIETRIEEYNPYIEEGPATTAWNMLNSGGSKWAQVGWWKDISGARWAFAQWTDNGGNWFTQFFTASPVGASPNYQTIYNPGANPKFLFERDNVVLWQANALWQPATVQVHGETHNLADQMPGGFNATLWFEEVHYTMGAGWLNINTAAGTTDPGNHGALKVNAEFYKIWDRDCAT